MSTRPRRLSAALLASAAIVLGACSDGAVGGADRLPDGPPPEDVAFAEAPEDSPSAPDFDLTLLDGTTITASDLWEERPVVLHFLASWCPACQEQQAEINEVAREFADEIVFIGITANDETDDITSYLRERKVPYAVGEDPEEEIWLRYGVAEPPLLAFITKGGVIVRGHPGGLDGDRLRSTIEENLLASD